jgi:DNA-binding PadR family transcriptional regulator
MKREHDAFWLGRHQHGRRFGHLAAGFMGGAGRGDGGFRTGRKLASADLQLVLLALLAEKPSHGYELIKALEDRSDGFYAPSPGMIYPALTYLEEIGHATVEPEGAKKLYRITDEGRHHLEQNRTTVDAILAELARIGGKMEHIRRIFAGAEPASEAEESDFDAGRSDEFHVARRALRNALRNKGGCAPEEARRIADVLRRATAEILGN